MENKDGTSSAKLVRSVKTSTRLERTFDFGVVTPPKFAWPLSGASPPIAAGALLRGRAGRDALLPVGTEPAGKPSFLGRPTGRLTLFAGSMTSPPSPKRTGFLTLPFGRPGGRFTGVAETLFAPFEVGFGVSPVF